jgi:hypothetical protein
MNLHDLMAIFKRTQASLSSNVREFNWANQEAYTMWLANSYEYALNSTRILALTAGAMPLQKTVYSNRFIKHAAEEKGHEKLLEKDVKAFGLNIKDIPVTHEMKMFHHSLYYWFDNNSSPMGIFGFVLALEGLAVSDGPWIYEQAQKAHGKGTSFLRVHSEEDPEHLNKAIEVLSSCTADDLKVVAASVEQYSKQYGLMLHAINSMSVQKKLVA